LYSSHSFCSSLHKVSPQGFFPCESLYMGSDCSDEAGLFDYFKGVFYAS
jgi:hypothetical protein